VNIHPAPVPPQGDPHVQSTGWVTCEGVLEVQGHQVDRRRDGGVCSSAPFGASSTLGALSERHRPAPGLMASPRPPSRRGMSTRRVPHGRSGV
jgi:hypothetical protein